MNDQIGKGFPCGICGEEHRTSDINCNLILEDMIEDTPKSTPIRGTLTESRSREEVSELVFIKDPSNPWAPIDNLLLGKDYIEGSDAINPSIEKDTPIEAPRVRTILEDTKVYLKYCQERLLVVPEKNKGFWRRQINQCKKRIYGP